MSQEYRIAIIGCGYWGGNYVRVFSELDGVQVTAISDKQEAMLDRFRSLGGNVLLTTSALEAIESGVDAVVVCTQASQHSSVALEAIDHGKHVLVEKPLTTRSADAKLLETRARSKGLVLMVGHTFMFNPAIRVLKEYVDKRSLGELYYLYSRRTNLGPIRHDVNALWDLAAHDISIFNYLVGATPLWVNANGVRVLGRDIEDAGFATLGYASGLQAHLHVSWTDPNKCREIVLVGSKRRILFDDLRRIEKIRVFEKGVGLAQSRSSTNYGEQFQMHEGDIVSPRVQAGEPLKEQCLAFLECLRNNSAPLTGAKEGVAVVRTLEAIDASMRMNGVRVELATEFPITPAIHASAASAASAAKVAV
jgi:predicted dehydrogenase